MSVIHLAGLGALAFRSSAAPPAIGMILVCLPTTSYMKAMREKIDFQLGFKPGSSQHPPLQCQSPTRVEKTLVQSQLELKFLSLTSYMYKTVNAYM